LAGWVALPIIAKWLLVGRWKPARFRLWGPAYLRWWTVKTLIRANPMALLTGSPLYVWYLRALGAKIGKNVAIFSRTIPIATDLIHIGDNTVIRRNCSFTGYRAIHGTIQTGTITLGRNATISDETVLDINTSMGDHAQLGHASSLSTGQHIPTGQTWHGTPAEPASPTANYQRIQTTHRTTIRKFVYTVLQLTILLLLVPVLTAAAIYLVTTVANLNNLETLGTHYLTTPTFYLAIAAVVALAYLALLILAILAILTIPHCARFLIKPGKTYPLYGIHHVAQQLITTLTNSQNLVLLLGDSAYITTFLRLLGYQMTPLIQTGSNFGTQHTHDSPHLTTIGTGTLVSDGLFAINAEFSNTSFRVDRVVIGGHNFLGNNIAFPAGARTGSNVLLATKVMVPTDGPIRENTGLLGSPPFEIPRTNPAHSKFEILDNPGLIRRQLTRKTRYNTRTLALIIAARTIQFIITAQAIAIAYVFYPQHHILATTAALLAMTLITAVYPLLAERAITGFRQLQPQHCTIYDPYFWKHERLWKFGTYPILPGTPFQNILWRLSGVHIGHRVFDDGSVIPEKTLVTIGDDAVLNAGVTIQNHSLEDGVFTSDRSTIGADTTIGTNAFVHLATTLADHTTLDAHAFLMKGSQTAPHTTWTGNPAEEAPQHTSPTHQRPGTPQTTNTSTNAHAAA
jgi:non-ribosomal peptide synthetase-like protein